MKVLGVVCSPRKGGNTEIMVEEVLAGARGAGAETELWTVAGKHIVACDGCISCINKSGECHIDDDIQKLYPKVREADGIIFGSPIYFSTLVAQALIVMHRMYCLVYQDAMVNKIAGAVVVGASEGHEGATLIFEKYFNLTRMIRSDVVTGFGMDRGEVRGDITAMKACNILGKSVVGWIKQGLRQPPEYAKPIYRVLLEEEGIRSFVTSARFKDIDELRRDNHIAPHWKRSLGGTVKLKEG